MFHFQRWVGHLCILKFFIFLFGGSQVMFLKRDTSMPFFWSSCLIS